MASSCQSQEWKEEKNDKCGGRGEGKESADLYLRVLDQFRSPAHPQPIGFGSSPGQSCALPQSLSRQLAVE